MKAIFAVSARTPRGKGEFFANHNDNDVVETARRLVEMHKESSGAVVRVPFSMFTRLGVAVFENARDRFITFASRVGLRCSEAELHDKLVFEPRDLQQTLHVFVE
jgi:hypothetical protein